MGRSRGRWMAGRGRLASPVPSKYGYRLGDIANKRNGTRLTLSARYVFARGHMWRIRIPPPPWIGVDSRDREFFHLRRKIQGVFAALVARNHGATGCPSWSTLAGEPAGGEGGFLRSLDFNCDIPSLTDFPRCRFVVFCQKKQAPDPGSAGTGEKNRTRSRPALTERPGPSTSGTTSYIIVDSSESVRKPWTMVPPNGVSTVRIGSIWMYWWTPPASSRRVVVSRRGRGFLGIRSR